VPDDVPLARSPGRMNAPAPVGVLPTPWWHRRLIWDVYVGVVAAVTAVIVAQSHWHPVPTRAAAVALIVAMAVWYLAAGRPMLMADAPGWRGYGYLVVAVALFVAAVGLVNGSSFLLWALCPQAYMILRIAPATVAVILINVLYVGVVFVRAGDIGAVTAGPLPTAVLAAVGFIVIGTWAQHVSRQNDERARLIEQLEDSRAEVARLSHEAGAIAERQRLAGEIHDTIAQGLSSVIMLIQAAEADLDRDPARAGRHLALAAGTARDNLDEARALVAALTPAQLDGTPLPGALARLVERFRAETGLRADFAAEGTPRPLPTPVEVVLLRAAQESLANVRRHAAAGAVTVRLSHLPGAAEVETRDDGRGFDPDICDGYGLRAMRTRVEQAGGTATVESAPGAGTTVRVWVPVP
jgi:signal transduction histidine kinase